MKLLVILTFCSLSLKTYSQCAKLYIKEHLSGSPICYLQEGDVLEICEDSDEIYGCPRNLYIIDKGYINGSLTYELSLDRGYGQYGTLMINTKTQRLAFIIQGQSAAYSYKSEFEIQKEEEARQAVLAEERKRKLNEDLTKYIVIDNLLSSKKIKEAYLEYSKLFFPGDYYNKSLVEKEYNTLQTQIRENERKEDELLVSSARKAIINNSDPLQYWEKIIHKENYKSFYNDTLFNWIVNSVGPIPEINITSSFDIDQFIETNKEALISYLNTRTPEGSINIQFDKQGISNIPNLKINQRIYKIISGVAIYQPTNINIPIQITEEFDQTKSTKYLANTSSKLAITKIGYRVYKVNYLTKNMFGNDIIDYSLDKTLTNKQIKIIEPYIQKINLNGKYFLGKSIDKSYVENFSPRIVRKTVKIISSVFWIGVVGVLTVIATM